jgi:hypothetical protein
MPRVSFALGRTHGVTISHDDAGLIEAEGVLVRGDGVVTH